MLPGLNLPVLDHLMLGLVSADRATVMRSVLAMYLLPAKCPICHKNTLFLCGRASVKATLCCRECKASIGHAWRTEE